MRYDITTGILDSDGKGKSGRGTIYWTEVRDKSLPWDQWENRDIHNTIQTTEQGFVLVSANPPLVERFEYGLLDILEKKFDLKAAIAQYEAENTVLEHQAQAAEAAEKKAKREEREASVKSDPVMDAILDTVIAQGTKAVTEYKAGKEKALNALVGMVIGQLKKQGLDADAFTINRLLRQKIDK